VSRLSRGSADGADAGNAIEHLVRGDGRFVSSAPARSAGTVTASSYRAYQDLGCSMNEGSERCEYHGREYRTA